MRVPRIAGLTGRVLYPGDPGWAAARGGFCARIDYAAIEPQAVVFCQDVRDVINALRSARREHLPFRARSGRHSYEGFSEVKGGVIIDVSELNFVRLDRDVGRVRVGAGIYQLDLYEKLWEAGVTVPGASGASVGVAGLTLGGGVGVTTRKFGLTCDQLVEVEVVTAGGKVIRANETAHADLFWACRGGGGGNFGIVTEFTFRVHPVSLVTAAILTWQWDQFDRVVPFWQEWAPDAHRDLTSFLRLSADPKITLYAQYTPDGGDLSGAAGLLGPALAVAPPSSVSIQAVPYIIAARMFAGVDPLHPTWLIDAHSDQQIFKSTSAFARQSLPPEALALLKTHVEASPITLPGMPNQPNMVQLLGGGGAAGDPSPTDTAVFHRDARFVLQYDAYWSAPEDAERNVAWVESVRRALQPFTTGAYVNYVDLQIEDWPRAYYGANLERLVEVKRQYDPHNVFQFPQSIPLSP